MDTSSKDLNELMQNYIGLVKFTFEELYFNFILIKKNDVLWK